MLQKNLIKSLLVIFIFTISSASLRASDDHDDGNDNHHELFEKMMDKLEHKKNLLEFDDAEIIFEQNFTDGDVEVVIFAKLEEAGAGMQRFWLYGPNGKVVYKFSTPKNNNNIGGREIVIESPEPADKDIVLGAYPEGTYTFVAKSFDKEWFKGEAELSHDLPAPATIQWPLSDSETAISNFLVTWTTDSTTHDKFIIELVNEDSELEEELLVDIPPERRTFRAPEEWMVPDSEYQVVVGIVNEHGNKTFVELNTLAY